MQFTLFFFWRVFNALPTNESTVSDTEETLVQKEYIEKTERKGQRSGTQKRDR